MCGRFTLKSSPKALAAAFELPETLQFPPRFNIAPSQPVAVIRAEPEGKGRELASLVWGLVPSWSKTADSGFINARSETAAAKPAFRVPLRRRRCLVLADGFYEWQRKNGAKQPYFFQLLGGKPFAFAGLWDRWEGEDGKPLETCALLTTEASATVKPIHARMPVILAPLAHEAWLDPRLGDPEEIGWLLRPYPAEEMNAYPVATRVNSPRFDGPDCVEPLAPERELFA